MTAGLPLNVLIDGRIAGQDGIGRYTRCVVQALRGLAGPRLAPTVLGPTGSPRYCRTEGRELVDRRRAVDADVLHAVDYRVPLDRLPVPLVVTVHDVLRLLRPEFCYPDEQFVARFGLAALSELRAVTEELRDLVGLPRGGRPKPGSLHEEFYARMLALTCARASAIVVPTVVVASQLRAVVAIETRVCVSPWGIDHLLSARAGPSPVSGRYLLYVGQARPHKGLDVLVDAFRRSRARSAGVRLVCVGWDFASGGLCLDNEGCDDRSVVAVGSVEDAELGRFYRHAEALVHLAEHEGFGFTPLEAFAAGTRVVAADIPVLRETLGEHAVFTAPHDADAVADAIDRVVTDRDDRLSRGQRICWAGRYRWSRHAEDLLSLYGEVAR